MGSKTSIEWTADKDGNAGASWNPIRARVGDRVGWHCEIVSPGCEHCYAETINHRLGTGDDYLKKARRAEVFLDEKMLTAPLHWRKPRRIFVGSMTDLFGDWVTDAMLDRIFAVIAICPQHVFQILTKRAMRMRVYCQVGLAGHHIDDFPPDTRWPLPNVWLGVSVEDQRRADERIPLLLETPATVRWISAEPLLGPLTTLYTSWGGRRLDWCVIGGESGRGARPMELAWARSIIAQCKAAGVPVFMKQLGSATGFNLHDRKGGDPMEWAADLRVREYPEERP